MEEKEEKRVRGMNTPIEISKRDGTKLVITSGTTYSLYNPDEDKFEDIYVHQQSKFKTAEGKVVGRVVYSMAKDKTPASKRVKKVLEGSQLRHLGNALHPTINQRFEDYYRLAKLTVEKKITSLLALGEGGLGKTYTVEMVLREYGYQEIQEDGNGDYIMMKGYTTALALFNLFEKYSDKLIILDDIDSAFKNRESENILKAALDSKRRRVITWATGKGKASTTFTGSVIILTNMNKDDFGSALLSRACAVDLYMSNEEKIQRLRYILPTIQVEGAAMHMRIEDREKVLAIIDKYKNSLDNFNARTLYKALQVYAESGYDLELTKSQIING